VTQRSDAPSRPKTVSVKKQFELLELVTVNPESVAKPVRDLLLPALVSQGAFAALELPELGIVSMSLNTHKAIANDVLGGRYEAMNEYRKAALEKLKAAERRAAEPGRGTLSWYKAESEEKTAKLKRVADDIAMMSQQLDEVLRLAHQMAKDAGKETEFNKARGEILRKFKGHDRR
jgi:hypothetical protein